eukprot:TRINITY_DN61725_c0_g1_i1.p1 TRINITY_DN61725_c0_g1~~TRINITY_DN61725_c0_g1_i1.p1  ORF type:complete len:582 (-),score=48.89 TRINITY_DN61725_c0_g1_i1:73-1818(-)
MKPLAEYPLCTVLSWFDIPTLITVMCLVSRKWLRAAVYSLVESQFAIGFTLSGLRLDDVEHAKQLSHTIRENVTLMYTLLPTALKEGAVLQTPTTAAAALMSPLKRKKCHVVVANVPPPKVLSGLADNLKDCCAQYESVWHIAFEVTDYVKRLYHTIPLQAVNITDTHLQISRWMGQIGAVQADFTDEAQLLGLLDSVQQNVKELNNQLQSVDHIFQAARVNPNQWEQISKLLDDASPLTLWDLMSAMQDSTRPAIEDIAKIAETSEHAKVSLSKMSSFWDDSNYVPLDLDQLDIIECGLVWQVEELKGLTTPPVQVTEEVFSRAVRWRNITEKCLGWVQNVTAVMKSTQYLSKIEESLSATKSSESNNGSTSARKRNTHVTELQRILDKHSSNMGKAAVWTKKVLTTVEKKLSVEDDAKSDDEKEAAEEASDVTLLAILLEHGSIDQSDDWCRHCTNAKLDVDNWTAAKREKYPYWFGLPTFVFSNQDFIAKLLSGDEEQAAATPQFVTPLATPRGQTPPTLGASTMSMGAPMPTLRQSSVTSQSGEGALVSRSLSNLMKDLEAMLEKQAGSTSNSIDMV